MKTTIQCLACLFLALISARAEDPVAKQFLRYMYGADGIDINRIAYPNVDNWMLRDAKNPTKLAAVEQEKIGAKKNGIYSGLIVADLYTVEVRDGRVDPSFTLELIQGGQKSIVRTLVYATLMRNQRFLKRATTDPSKVTIVGEQASSGDMDQYGEIVSILPVIRTSKPESDAKTHTVTYRVPLGDAGLSVTLINRPDGWQVDTSKGLRISTDFFFQRDEKRRVIPGDNK
jgi:hypothetical protein